jgi:hypothetical protein
MKALVLYFLGFMTGILFICSVILSSNPLYANLSGKLVMYIVTIVYIGFSIFIIKKNLEK